ncbi:MAG: hypothetical protein Q9219_006249 [cf. Caloplaca sp. 3 TL-2023]
MSEILTDTQLEPLQTILQHMESILGALGKEIPDYDRLHHVFMYPLQQLRTEYSRAINGGRLPYADLKRILNFYMKLQKIEAAKDQLKNLLEEELTKIDQHADQEHAANMNSKSFHGLIKAWLFYETQDGDARTPEIKTLHALETSLPISEPASAIGQGAELLQYSVEAESIKLPDRLFHDKRVDLVYNPSQMRLEVHLPQNHAESSAVKVGYDVNYLDYVYHCNSKLHIRFSDHPKTLTDITVKSPVEGERLINWITETCDRPALAKGDLGSIVRSRQQKFEDRQQKRLSNAVIPSNETLPETRKRQSGRSQQFL